METIRSLEIGKSMEVGSENFVCDLDSIATSKDVDSCFECLTIEQDQTLSNSVHTYAVRKDTKDSGFGDALLEHEEEQGFIPDWCRECQNSHEDNERQQSLNCVSLENNNTQRSAVKVDAEQCGSAEMIAEKKVRSYDNNNDQILIIIIIITIIIFLTSSFSLYSLQYTN